MYNGSSWRNAITNWAPSREPDYFVYPDFLKYKSGVYINTNDTQQYLGGQTPLSSLAVGGVERDLQRHQHDAGNTNIGSCINRGVSSVWGGYFHFRIIKDRVLSHARVGVHVHMHMWDTSHMWDMRNSGSNVA